MNQPSRTWVDIDREVQAQDVGVGGKLRAIQCVAEAFRDWGDNIVWTPDHFKTHKNHHFRLFSSVSQFFPIISAASSKTAKPNTRVRFAVPTMPLPTKWHKKNKRPPPAGFDSIEPVLEALENELRDRIKESNVNKRKTESLWPVHQINWQKSRYVYDMYYTHRRISQAVYQYCIDQKLVDAALIAKWKKPGYERLCSTYVINPANYKFGTVSLCRVPWKNRTSEQKQARDPTVGSFVCFLVRFVSSCVCAYVYRTTQHEGSASCYH